ncbi:hypothetical protein AB4Y36_38270 [Paraburkholderia sp. BR10936]|uniref:hypothetical protein n=1 Tax=Paraburkholderia sp. BR10936 TaxID=3236993 RepID=UPI0034D1E41A
MTDTINILPHSMRVPEPAPWLDEPNLATFRIDEYLCVALRHPWGHWCGYVGVGAQHPLFGVSFHELEDAGEALYCHGSLNFADRLDEFTGWYFGFDCGHAFDYSPYMAEYYRRIGMPDDVIREHDRLFVRNEHGEGGVFPRQYRDLDFVRANCVAIAAQLMDIVKDEAKVREIREAHARQTTGEDR